MSAGSADIRAQAERELRHIKAKLAERRQLAKRAKKLEAFLATWDALTTEKAIQALEQASNADTLPESQWTADKR